ncbi:MAG: sugar transferase [Oscillospiraceae bacterium]
MMLKAWNDLPEFLRCDEIAVYYTILKKKTVELQIKRLFDITMSAILLVALLPLMTLIAIAIKTETQGEVIFKQQRVTSYGKIFEIYKFRTMYKDDTIGSKITMADDNRITTAGKLLRKYRFDEIPQLVNILRGDMTFVGTRPEVPYYIEEYSTEMLATLLLPAGLTSMASIKYKDEAKLLNNTDNIDEIYINKILPQKMKINLEYIKKFSLKADIQILIETFIRIFI